MEIEDNANIRDLGGEKQKKAKNERKTKGYNDEMGKSCDLS